MQERTRAWKRFQAEKTVKRQMKIWWYFWHLKNSNRVPGKYRKQSVLGCRCSKTTKGRPHCSSGFCYDYVGPGLLERRRGKALCREAH